MTMTEWEQAAEANAIVSDSGEYYGYAMLDPEGHAWITGGWSTEGYVNPAEFHVVIDPEDIVTD